MAVVVCGMRVDETLNMLKSALLFNTDKHPLRFVIVTEDALRDRFKEKVRITIISHPIESRLIPSSPLPFFSWTTGRL